MTADVLDFSWWRPAIADLKAAGIVAVSRYLAWYPPGSPGKVILKPEYDALRAAGIEVVLNWESTGTSYTGGYAQGVKDGAEARRQARALGHPDTRPIIQSVDTGIQPSQVLYDYQRGFNDGGGVGIQGFYGDAACADALFARALISVFWQANARGWPGSSVDDPRAALIQRTSKSHANLPANQYDESDRKQLDFAQAPAPAQAPAAPVTPPAVVSFLQAVALFLAALVKRAARSGDTSALVGSINALLHRLGYVVSGNTYGPSTVKAVASFKATHGIAPADGTIVDKVTYTKLLSAVATVKPVAPNPIKVVTPMHNPPIEIPGGIAASVSGSWGTYLVNPIGQVYALDGAVWHGNVAGQPYWGDRKVAGIKAFRYGLLNRKVGYTIFATDGGPIGYTPRANW